MERNSFLVAAIVGVALGLSGSVRADKGAETNVPPPASAGAAAQSSSPSLAKPAGPKDSKPLLLLDDEPEAQSSPKAGADNSRCQVCHLNLAKEELVVIHAKANIGCAKCHGASDAHIADESWASGGNGTAPDTMFPQPKINPLCLSCHAKEKINSPPHQEILAAKGEKQYCTDCHGKHRLLNRKCKWK